jgi:hypothetical protein
VDKRQRNWVVSVCTVVLSLAVARGTHDAGWADAERYAALAGMIVLIVLVGVPWVELPRRGEPGSS